MRGFQQGPRGGFVVDPGIPVCEARVVTASVANEVAAKSGYADKSDPSDRSDGSEQAESVEL